MLNPLHQRLKELDPPGFQQLVFHLLKEQRPNNPIKYLDGKGGDGGLDIVEGELDSQPAVWQCKAFPNGIKDPQKQQIRESLKTAIKNYAPRSWTLCVNIDIDDKALRWFQRLTVSQARATSLHLYQASDMVHELLYRNTIREQFFPGAVIDTKTMRKIVAKTGELTTGELRTLTTENLDQYLHRLQDRDARFAYALTQHRNHRPDEIQAPPGALAAVTSGHQTIAVYPRDHDALRAHPAKASFTLTGTGIDKYNDFLRTGRRQTFNAPEVVDFRSDLDFLLPSLEEGSARKLELFQRPGEQIPLQITFGRGDRAVVYKHVMFQRARTGTEELGYESLSPLPFQILLTIRADGTGDVNFHDQSIGSDVHEVHRFLSALEMAMTTSHLDFYDLVNTRPFLESHLRTSVPDWLPQNVALLADLVAVTDAYATTITIPAEPPSPADYQALGLLGGLITGITLPPADITLTLVKRPDVDESGMRALFDGECSFRITGPPHFPDPVLFGRTISTGPLEFYIPRARVRDRAALQEFIENAAAGATTTVILEPTSPVTARRLAAGEEP